MSSFKENEKLENEVGSVMAKYQAYIKDLTGMDPRGGQIGPIEIYKIARKAAEDVLKESKTIITDLSK
jgi:hypothetical protein